MTAPVAVSSPDGAHWSSDEVKTDRGTRSLGEHPLLVWDSLDGAVEFYGDEGILQSLDGTSFRVSFQSIARRMAIAGKNDEEIADAQLKFRPGKRAVGASTPVSRARRAGAAAAEALGDNADAVTDLLKKVASGDLSAEDLKAMIAD